MDVIITRIIFLVPSITLLIIMIKNMVKAELTLDSTFFPLIGSDMFLIIASSIGIEWFYRTEKLFDSVKIINIHDGRDIIGVILTYTPLLLKIIDVIITKYNNKQKREDIIK